MSLRRLAPTPIKQNAGGLHARSRRILRLAHDRSQVTDTLRRVGPAQ
jgi:hypothetical protein